MFDCNHTEGKRHDCEYVDARNRFLDAAAKVADKKHPRKLPPRPPVPKDGEYSPEYEAWKELKYAWGAKWDFVFIAEMDRLAVGI
ncbi:MAG: hypothetical protein WC700_14990 [Gemmatimonadaceae bacterium]|jgi:hypothetical protein